MKYEVYLTRNLKQFVQLTVDAPTTDLAETFAVLKAQEMDESEWEPELASAIEVEHIQGKA